MEKRIPKGLIIFSIILLISSLWTTRVFFISEPKVVFCDRILSGALFKYYYLGLGILNLTIAIGILKLKSWAYFGFMAFTAYSIVLSLVTIFSTRYETMIQAGWNLSNNNMTSFYMSQGLVILISTMMFAWLYKYRKHINAKLDRAR